MYLLVKYIGGRFTRNIYIYQQFYQIEFVLCSVLVSFLFNLMRVTINIVSKF